MIRSILVVVDDSGSSLAGARCAFDLARRCGAYVEIRRSKFVPIGGLTSKTMLDLGLLERADKRISAVLKSFREDAGGHATASFEAHEIDGDPLAQTGLEAVAHDVIILGNQILFCVDRELGMLPSCGNRIGGYAPPAVILLCEPTVAPILVDFDEARRFPNTTHAGAAPIDGAAPDTRAHRQSHKVEELVRQGHNVRQDAVRRPTDTATASS